MSLKADIARLKAELAKRQIQPLAKRLTLEGLDEELRQLNDQQLAMGMSQAEIDAEFEEYARTELAKEFHPSAISNILAFMTDRKPTWYGEHSKEAGSPYTAH